MAAAFEGKSANSLLVRASKRAPFSDSQDGDALRVVYYIALLTGITTDIFVSLLCVKEHVYGSPPSVCLASPPPVRRNFPSGVMCLPRRSREESAVLFHQAGAIYEFCDSGSSINLSTLPKQPESSLRPVRPGVLLISPLYWYVSAIPNSSSWFSPPALFLMLDEGCLLRRLNPQLDGFLIHFLFSPQPKTGPELALVTTSLTRVCSASPKLWNQQKVRAPSDISTRYDATIGCQKAWSNTLSRSGSHMFSDKTRDEHIYNVYGVSASPALRDVTVIVYGNRMRGHVQKRAFRSSIIAAIFSSLKD
ncbi:uncharacterized protein ARMOST_21808 [Armillaria ostoyae]|uniref:Uncharacterized protein n=1 Tax=Armillaria ostoyae TaxID=47428 RepID=A0A284SB40_ARMOS|nr:uncharacterized protein ARMOST_21808 [Armillaria ostoyae]